MAQRSPAGRLNVRGASPRAVAEPPKEKIELIEHAEAFVANTGAKIEYGGNRAYYAITTDVSRMPL
jgi:antirestriction protein ArdC